MSQRLQKVIAQAGIASRRKAEELITTGKVKVNGIVVTELGTKVSVDDVVQVNNKSLRKESKVVYMINKPMAVLSASSDDRDRRVVVDLINDTRRLFPVGRLDYNTTGLLLVTNDGDFSQLMIHPSSNIPKEYHVKIRGQLTTRSIELMKKGLRTKEENYAPVEISKVRIDKEKKITHFDIVLFEGKNRQIKKMMEHLNHDVLALNRFRIGPLHLGTMAIGKYRKLSTEEISILERYAERRHTK